MSPGKPGPVLLCLVLSLTWTVNRAAAGPADDNGLALRLSNWFGPKLSEVVEQQPDIQSEIKGPALELGLDPALVTAVVMPEVLRYHSLRDKMETMALRAFYVKFGSPYTDFSIGIFQMKVSFLRQLNNYLAGVELSDHRALARITQWLKLDERTQNGRAAVVDSLLNENSRCRYIAAFVYLARHKYARNLSGRNRQWQLRFLAAAYNSGLQRSAGSILKNMNRAGFPHGREKVIFSTGTRTAGHDRNPFIYSNVALYFYTRPSE